MTVSEIHQKIVDGIKSKEDKKNRDHNNIYHRGYRLPSYGLKAAVLAKILTGFKKEIKSLSCQDVFKLADKFYKAGTEEEVMAGNYTLQINLDCFDKKNLSALDKFTGCLISWSTADDFVADVLQPLMFKMPDEIIILLRKWNKSKKFWQKRVSVVAFTRKIGRTGRFTKEALTLCENLISSEEDLIQKAVGWSLKDIMRGDKKVVLDYVKKLRGRGISSTIILYAVRELAGKERASVLGK